MILRIDEEFHRFPSFSRRKKEKFGERNLQKKFYNETSARLEPKDSGREIYKEILQLNRRDLNLNSLRVELRFFAI